MESSTTDVGSRCLEVFLYKVEALLNKQQKTSKTGLLPTEIMEKRAQLIFKYLSSFRSLINFKNLASYGINVCNNMGELKSTLMEHDLLLDEPIDEKRLERFIADDSTQYYATTQLNKGFPDLYKFCMIQLWTSLEVYINDLVAFQILHDPQAREDERIKKIQIPAIYTLDILDRNILAEIVTDRLVDVLEVRFKSGISRFKSLLNATGFGISFPKIVSSTLFELNNIRNLFVHRNGRVDLRFCENCPNVDVSPNDTLYIDSEVFNYYKVALQWLFIECLRLNGHPVDDIIDKIRKECLNYLNTNKPGFYK